MNSPSDKSSSYSDTENSLTMTELRPVNSPGAAGRLPVLIHFSRSPDMKVFSPGCHIEFFECTGVFT